MSECDEYDEYDEYDDGFRFRKWDKEITCPFCDQVFNLEINTSKNEGQEICLNCENEFEWSKEIDGKNVYYDSCGQE